jgi:hypothetical protein
LTSVDDAYHARLGDVSFLHSGLTCIKHRKLSNLLA